jgi:hypothetical protein
LFIPAQGQKRLNRWLRIGVIVVSLCVMYAPSLVEHMKRSADPYHFNNDTRQHVVPFLRYTDTTLFPNDSIGDYYLACLPIGYRALYTMAALFWDPIALSKLLPYVLLGILLAAVGLAAGRLGGMAAAWAAIAFCLSSGVYLSRMGGGLPRAFAFPLIACAAAVLVHGRIYGLVALVCFATALYPVMAVIMGIALVTVLLFLPATDRGSASGWSLRRRAAIVAGTALLAGLMILPTLSQSSAYGPLLSAADVASYPEAGPGGRYIAEDRAPFLDLPTEVALTAPRAFVGLGRPWSETLRTWAYARAPDPRQLPPRLENMLMLILGVICAGAVVLVGREAAARRLMALVLAVSVGHIASRVLAPYLFLPQRYVAYPLPVLATIMLPAAVAALPGLLGRVADRPGVRAGAVLVFCGTCLLLFGARGSSVIGLHPHSPRGVYGFIGSLRPDVLVAGWPMGLVNDIPYLSRRQAFVTFETHQAFHLEYVEEMRRRMHALIDAYFATTPRPLDHLRDEFGVTHLIVDKSHYREAPPRYFAPFDAWTSPRHAAAREGDLEITRQLDTAAVFDEGSVVVLDLRRPAATDADDGPNVSTRPAR